MCQFARRAIILVGFAHLNRPAMPGSSHRSDSRNTGSRALSTLDLEVGVQPLGCSDAGYTA